jgi:MFS transporter, DHA1 family, multidrug resistance protein
MSSEMVAPRAAQRASWVGNFIAILACQLFVFATFNSALPFLPLYLRELGEDEAGAVAWTGLTQSAGSAVLLVATPLWGALADRVGRKPMVVRSLVGGAISIGLMGFATQAWHLLLLRALQGATAGTNSAVIALAASVLPTARLGLGLGLLQTAQFLGGSFGPLLGGVTGAALGYRGSFAGAGASLLAIAGMVALLVREPAVVAARSAPMPGLRQRLATVARAPRLRAPILAILGFQAAYAVSVSLLPLHVYSLTSGGVDAPTAVGAALAAGALGVATGAAVLGWLGGRVGTRTVALLSLAGSGLLSLPQAWLTHPLQFIPLRLVLGFCAGGVLPSLRATLGEEAGADRVVGANLGSIYGLAQSAFAGGMMLGPPLSSLVATLWGLPAIHVASAALLLATAAWWRALIAGPAGQAGRASRDG